MLTAVIEKLDELIQVQNQLIDLADKKQTILIERKINELNLLVKQEAKLLDQLGRLEDERMQLVESVLEKNPSLSIHDVIEQTADELLKKKAKLQIGLLQQSMVELQAKNKVNERLLKDSIHFVQHMIEQVTKSKQQNFNYQSPLGQHKSQTTSRGFFDTKA